jgi:hypothetical protein
MVHPRAVTRPLKGARLVSHPEACVFFILGSFGKNTAPTQSRFSGEAPGDGQPIKIGQPSKNVNEMLYFTYPFDPPDPATAKLGKRCAAPSGQRGSRRHAEADSFTTLCRKL